jgi:hypothetical protein
MSDISRLIPSFLEQLPNEILMTIVSHIDYTERFKIIGTLNKRFRSIVRHVGIGIDCRNAKEAIQNDLIFDYCSSLIYYHLDDQVSWIDLSKCPQLRSLLLSKQSQLASILPQNMPNLAHICITTAFNTSVEAQNLVRKVFANQFSHLKSVRFARFNFLPQIECAQIQSVEINTTQVENFGRFLELLPNLVFLKTEIRSNNDWNSKTAPNLGSIIHLKLRHLNVKINHNRYAFEVSIMYHNEVNEQIQLCTLCKFELELSLKTTEY